MELQSLKKIGLLLLIYVSILSITGIMIKETGLNEYGLKNSDPEWKFVTGLNYESSGTYSDDLNRIIEESASRQEMSKMEKSRIGKQITYLNNNNKWFNLFISKISLLWSKQSSAVSASGFHLNHSGAISNFMNIVGYSGSLLIIIFSWIGSIYLFKGKSNYNVFIIVLPILAFAVIELFIEVQGRYWIEFVPMLTIFAGMGLYKVFESIDVIKSRYFGDKYSKIRIAFS